MVPASIFNSTTTVEWKMLQPPKFRFKLPDANNQIYVTKPSEIQIILETDHTYESLEYKYAISPIAKVNTTKITQSADKSTFLLSPYALQFGTVYTLNVTVTNPETNNSTSRAIRFETKASPGKGTLQVNP